jgi:hypothetical protein
VALGLDAATGGMLRSYRKGFRPADIAAALTAARSSRIPYTIHILFGGPGETDESVREALDVLEELAPDDTIFFALGLRVFTGTYRNGRLQGQPARSQHADAYLSRRDDPAAEPESAAGGPSALVQPATKRRGASAMGATIRTWGRSGRHDVLIVEAPEQSRGWSCRRGAASRTAPTARARRRDAGVRPGWRIDFLSTECIIERGWHREATSSFHWHMKINGMVMLRAAFSNSSVWMPASPRTAARTRGSAARNGTPIAVPIDTPQYPTGPLPT